MNAAADMSWHCTTDGVTWPGCGRCGQCRADAPRLFEAARSRLAAAERGRDEATEALAQAVQSMSDLGRDLTIEGDRRDAAEAREAELRARLEAVDRALAFAPRSMSLGEMNAFEAKGSLPWVRMLTEARAALDAAPVSPQPQPQTPDGDAALTQGGQTAAIRAQQALSALAAPSPQETTASDEPKGTAMTGAELIAAERKRQINVEGYAPAHDADHGGTELVAAAACYLTAPQFQTPVRHAVVISHGPHAGQPWTPAKWPWQPKEWKPSPNDRVRELVKAGALIAAEIDRLRARRPVSPQEAGQ